ncbi:MAG: hypothetical protein HGB26_02920 [Desulfobulbaceae bacterium]|nr:hypothetical protein [Desulfobulbaceae bacterium]
MKAAGRKTAEKIFSKFEIVRNPLLSALLIFILSGCATKTVSTGPVFFPPPPDEPRIQYLTGINDSRDLLGEKRTSSLVSLVVTGKDQGNQYRRLGKSFGIVAKNNKLYLCELGNHEVVIIDPVKKVFESPKGIFEKRGQLVSPLNMDVDKDGYMYVADTSRGDVVIYGPDGGFVKTISTSPPTNLPPEAKIVDVKVYGENLFLLDSGTGWIRVLNRKSLVEVNKIGKLDKPGESILLPVSMVIDDKGFIYVTNTGNGKTMKYDVDGNFLGALGKMGDKAGSFARPKGVAVDHEGRIYVVDAGLNAVQVFDDQMRLLIYFGWPGLEAGSLNLPSGIAVTKENLDIYQKFAAPGFQVETLIFVVSQFGQEFNIPRISVYGLGQMKK